MSSNNRAIAPIDSDCSRSRALRDDPPHHEDPVDRLLIAQATIEQIPLITADPRFDAYDIERIDAQN